MRCFNIIFNKRNINLRQWRRLESVMMIRGFMESSRRCRDTTRVEFKRVRVIMKTKLWDRMQSSEIGENKNNFSN